MSIIVHREMRDVDGRRRVVIAANAVIVVGSVDPVLLIVATDV